MITLAKFDRWLTSIIQGWPDAVRPIMAAATFAGEPLMVTAIGFVGFISSINQGRPDVTRAFVWAAIAFGINTALKLFLHRRRPHNLSVITLGIPSYSFPSGHAFGTIIFYGLFSYLDFRYLTHPWNLLIGSLLVLLIFLIGLSRVYLAAHYPSDVTAGWLLGGVSLILIIWLVL